MKETIDTTLSNLGQLDEMSGFIDTLTKNGMQNVARISMMQKSAITSPSYQLENCLLPLFPKTSSGSTT